MIQEIVMGTSHYENGERITTSKIIGYIEIKEVEHKLRLSGDEEREPEPPEEDTCDTCCRGDNCDGEEFGCWGDDK